MLKRIIQKENLVYFIIQRQKKYEKSVFYFK